MVFEAREGDVRRFDALDLPSLTVAGLDTEAAEQLLARGTALSVSVRDHPFYQTHGNALALVELPAALTAE